MRTIEVSLLIALLCLQAVGSLRVDRPQVPACTRKHTTVKSSTPAALKGRSSASISDSKISRMLKKSLGVLASTLLCTYCSPALSFAETATTTATNSESTIDLYQQEPRTTDTCYLDVQVGKDPTPHRIEIALYGDVVPITVQNFKSLCSNERGWGYKGSDFYRVISTYSVQAGNIGNPPNALLSEYGKYGKSAIDDKGLSFPPENYRILHNYPDAGVVSMARDTRNKNFQDSRFFITTNPVASWADGKYVAFGRVTNGMSIVQGMQLLEVKPPSNHPVDRVRILDSGLLPPTAAVRDETVSQ